MITLQSATMTIENSPSPAAVTSGSSPELAALESAYQDLCKRVLSSESLCKQANALKNENDQINFFTIVRPDARLLELSRVFDSAKLSLTEMREKFGIEGRNTSEALTVYQHAENQVKERVAGLIWAATNELASVTQQANEMAKRLAEKKKMPAVADSVSASGSQSPAEAATTAQEAEEIRKIKALVQNSPDLINATEGKTRNTPLEQAILNGHLKVVEYLLANGADTKGSKEGSPPVYLAAFKGQKAILELLLAKGGDVNAFTLVPEGKISALDQAVRWGYKSIVESLIAHKADVNIGGRYNETPLFCAAENNDCRIAEMLLAAGAQVNAKDVNAQTPLIFACYSNSLDAAKLLIEHGADVNAVNPGKLTPLHLAAINGNAGLAALLLAKGADVNAEGGGKVTPLHEAALCGNTNVAALLIAKGARVDVIVNSQGVEDLQRGPVPLTWAIASNRADMVKFLLENHANPNFEFTWWDRLDNFTPLLMTIEGKSPSLKKNQQPPPPSYYYSTPSRRKEIVQSLLEHGANPDGKGALPDRNPLIQAIRNTDDDAIQLLIQHKANVNIVSSNGETPLWVAADRDYRLAVEHLLDAGADINCLCTMDDMPLGRITPLHDAVLRRNTNMVELLLKRKANPNAVDGTGRPPLSYVNKAGSDVEKKIYDLLIQAGADVNFERTLQLSIQQPEGGTRSIFARQSNVTNRYTLVELIAQDYYDATKDGRAFGTVPFPDFSHVLVKRLQPDGSSKTIQADVQAILDSGNRANDIPLEWGDIVTIPEADHLKNSQWTILPRETFVQFANLLNRNVEVVIKGQRTSVTLVTPLVQRGGYRNFQIVSNGWPTNIDMTRFSSSAYTEGTVGQLASGTNGSIRTVRPNVISGVGTDYLVALRSSRTNPVVVGFELINVLNDSGLLRASSDTSRIKVTRRELGGTERTLPVNYDPKTHASHWLLDGDVIEIPDRESKE